MAATVPCSTASLDGGEPMWGTANDQIRLWIMVEGCEPWGPKVPAQAGGLSSDVRDRLMKLDDLRHARVQLIRRPRGERDQIRVFVARVEEGGGALYGLSLPDSAALLSLDVDAVAEGKGVGARIDQPVFFVCTHGARDACCAKNGVPVYSHLARRVPERAWQCSHLGGHRFSPTMLVLPYGAVYGRVPLGEVDALVDSADSGSLHGVDYLRGRSCFDPVVQAAEAMLRVRTGRLAVEALRLESREALDAGGWEVTFSDDDGLHHLRLRRDTSEQLVYGGCDDAAPRPYAHFVFVAHRRG